MKEINEKQLLELNEVERCKVLKMIILGEIKYIGDDTNERT